MSADAGAGLALKNAWSGALATSDRLRELAPLIESAATGASFDLETVKAAALAHAIAAQALRGLAEELHRASSDAATPASGERADE
jgi:hypothetical protein